MASTDLTSLAAVRAFLQKPTADTNQDAEISTLITAASTAIMRWTGREFAPAVTSTARIFAYKGGGILDLAPYDCRSVSAVVLDTDLGASDQTTLETTDFALRPLPVRDGVYQWLRLPNHGVADSPGRFPERQVTVTGTWGFAAVPENVAHACIVTVAIWLRRDVAAFSTTFSINEDRLERPEAMPSAVIGLLSPYRRPTVR